MSAGTVLQAAVVAHLSGLGRVFAAPPMRAALPYVVVEDPGLAADDAVGVAARTGSIAIACVDAMAASARERLAMVEAALAQLPRDLAGGWRVTALRLARSQMVQGRNERWTATGVFAVRMYRVN